MRNTIATPIVDKNGKLTTVHKGTAKPLPKPTSGALAASAPALGAAVKKRAYKPLKRQRAAGQYRMRVWCENISTGMFVDPADNVYIEASFAATEEEIFSVLSVSSGSNAAVMLQAGVRDREGAIEYYQERGLDHLAVDRSELMKEALQTRRIEAKAFLTFDMTHSNLNFVKDAEPELFSSEQYPDTYLDAAEATSSPALNSIYYGGIPDMILHRKLTYSDIKTVGIRTLMNSENSSFMIQKMLKLKEAGDDAKYDINHLSAVFDTNDIVQAQLLIALENEGGDFTQYLHKNFGGRVNEHKLASTRGITLNEILGYNRRLEERNINLSASRVRIFIDMGITTDTVIAHFDKQAEPEEEALRLQGIQNGMHSSIAGGFL